MANPNLSNEQFRRILGANTKEVVYPNDPQALEIRARKGGARMGMPGRTAPYPTAEIAGALSRQKSVQN